MGAALVALWSTLAGAILTYLYDPRARIGARLCAGIALGMALLGFAGYFACAAHGRMDLLTLGVALAFAGLPYLLLYDPNIRARVARDLSAIARRPHTTPSRLALWTVAVATFLVLLGVFRGAMYYNDQGDLITNNHLNIGDLPFHVAVVHGFVLGDNFPPQHPEFSGARLTYPFLVDFVHAQYMQCGASLTNAALLQNTLLAVALLGLFYRWAFALTRSTFATLSAPLLVLFSGGFGFTRLFEDFKTGRIMGMSPLAVVKQLPRDYTLDDAVHLRWGNAVTTLLTTQRGLMLAIPMALIVLNLLWQRLTLPRGREDAAQQVQGRALRAAGLITGCIPLIHGHTYLVLMIVGAGLAVEDLWPVLWAADVGELTRRVRAWAGFFLPAIALAVPQAVVLAQSSSVRADKFVGWAFGWDHGDMALPQFWIWNLGAFVPLLFVALVWRRRGRPLIGKRLVLYYVPFIACFIIPNVMRLAPWIWDNMKMLFYWHLASSVLIAALLGKLWDSHRFRGATRPAAIVIIVALTLAGALDVSRIARGLQQQTSYTAADIAFAHAVDATTPRNAVILHYPVYNHPVTYAGRHLVMGYEGHLWSHGLDYSERRRDVILMYAGGSAAIGLFQKYGVQYVVVGPDEIVDPDRLGIRANPAFFSQYPVAVRSGPWTLYRVAGAPAGSR